MNSGSWWWTGRPRVLWFMGSQRVGHDWATQYSHTRITHVIFMDQEVNGHIFPSAENRGVSLINTVKEAEKRSLTSFFYLHRWIACMYANSLQARLFVTLWTLAWQAPLSMGFFGKNTGVGCHAPLQGIFSTQGLNPDPLYLLHWQVASLPLVLLGSPICESGAMKSFKLNLRGFYDILI